MSQWTKPFVARTESGCEVEVVAVLDTNTWWTPVDPPAVVKDIVLLHASGDVTVNDITRLREQYVGTPLVL